MKNKFEQSNIDESKKNKMVAITLSILSLFVLIGIGMAYFSAPTSNTNRERFSTETSTIALEFADNDNGISGTLNLGESITKKFTLQNTGTKDAYAKINWYNLVNTYTANSLTWTLEQSTSENGTYTSVGSGNVPTSSTATTAVLKNGLLVPVNTTYYYKLTITLNNLDIDQNSDINATFYSYFSLEEGSLSGADTIQNLVAGEPTNTTDVITKPAPGGATCTNTLAYDGTSDNNLRYVGANPCNYVTFNGENPTTGLKWVDREISSGIEYDIFDTESECTTFLQNNGYTETDECIQKTITIGGWRIIGVMNNVDDGTGNTETRIKLIRNDSLGKYSWDSSASNVNSGNGVNDWTQADLMQELNGDYLNTSLNANTNWYNGQNNQKTGEYDYKKRLGTSAQNLIGDAKWFLGGPEAIYYIEGVNGTALHFYGYERGTEVWPQVATYSGATCNDGACPRNISWTGKVALAYPSDYGYAVGEEARSTCLGKDLLDYGSDNCHLSQWLTPSGWIWLLSPSSGSPDSAYQVGDNRLTSSYTRDDVAVLPAVYLQSGVTISGGNGSIENPYTLS